MFSKILRHISPTLLALLFSTAGKTQTALVQFIHNSPDEALQQVDVWLSDSLWADNINFHVATAMLPVTAMPLAHWEVRHALDSSITYCSWNTELSANSKHIFTLHGHLTAELYNPYRPVSVEQFNQAMDLSASTSSIDILFFHGATDLDTVDIAESQLFQLTAFNQLPYGTFSSYLNLFTADYGWSILDSSGTETLGEFALPTTALNWAGKAITIVSGGFFNQSNNSNGQPLGMWATTRDGGPMVCLQPLQWNLTADVQFLHNSSMAASGSIRIETDDSVWVSNLNTHEATPFIPFPAGKDIVMSIHSNLLGSPIDSIWSDTLHLFSGSSYQVYWIGGSSPEAPTQLVVHSWETTPTMENNAMLLRLFHGSPSEPVVSLRADTTNQISLFEDISYGTVSDTMQLALQNDEWLLFTQTDSITTLQAPLDTLNLGQRNVTALTYSDLSDPVPSIWLCSELGGPMHPLSNIEIPIPPQYCSVQLVHASADLLLHDLDVWINDSLYASPLTFESATGFLIVRCNDPVIVRTALHDGPMTTLLNDTIDFQANQLHRLFLWGIYDSPNYNPSPSLAWLDDTNISLSSTNISEIDLRFLHAATDLGSINVDVLTIPVTSLFNSIEPGSLSPTQSLSASENYGIELRNAPTQFLYDTYALPALGENWENDAIVLISTGFRQPANNNNGQSLQVWALTPSGAMVALDDLVHVANTNPTTHLAAFPNPAADFIQIRGNAGQNEPATLRIVNSMGCAVVDSSIMIRQGKFDETISTATLPVGLYYATLQSGNELQTISFCISR
jgi:hypothetical protein